MRLNRQIKVGLVQVSERFKDQYYLPYSVGICQAYAQKNLKNPEEFVFFLPLYKKVKIAESIEYLLGADIVFFSTYVWNFNISLEIAKGIKQDKANCIIVFGGPQVPESAVGLEHLLRKYPFIDIGCCQEGERQFLRILENIEERSWENIPSIGFIDKNGRFTYIPVEERIKNLDEIPSPYLEGVFDPLLEANPQENWSALLETNRGCPYTCTFCYWGKKNKVYQFDIERVFKEIDWIAQKKIEFVFCCDANFGLFERDADIARKVAENKNKYGYPMVFSVQNTKNSNEKIFMIQKILSDARLQKGVNLAFQSLNEDTLKSINRINISNKSYREIQQKFTCNDIPTFSDMIIGLPNETYDTFTRGVSDLIDSGQHNRIQFINLAVLENTTISEPRYQKKYNLLIKESKIIPHHSSVEDETEIDEMQKVIIGNATMPKEDWVKTKVFCWMASLLYFNKLLQIPFIILHKIFSLDYRKLVEVFTSPDVRYPIFFDLYSFFTNKAIAVQNGDLEYCPSKEWLNIWWTTDELILIKLCVENKLTMFYEEAERLINSFLKNKILEVPERLLKDSIYLNQNLIKLPLMNNDSDISLSYNIWEVYQATLRGELCQLKDGVYHYRINRSGQTQQSWENWVREVIWYGNKMGAYLYNCEAVNL